jgi:hypothetical protein
MRNYMLLLSTLFLLMSGCVSQQEKPIHSSKSADIIEPEEINYWLDEETGTVHKVITVNGAEKVVSIIKYKDGNPLEVMKIISSGSVDGKIHWIYFVPSTRYIVELTAVSRNDEEIKIEWKNRNEEGDEDSGTDILLRCAEYGVPPGKEKISAEEDILPEDFSSFDNQN